MTLGPRVNCSSSNVARCPQLRQVAYKCCLAVSNSNKDGKVQYQGVARVPGSSKVEKGLCNPAFSR